MIELCNELGADPWFCMPHRADDTYVDNFATMVLDGVPASNIPPLHTVAKIYVEWSNEVWNNRSTPTDVYDWVANNAVPGEYHPMGGGANIVFFDKWADEAANDFKRWHQVFAGQEDRIVRVAAGQAANVWVTDKLTDRLKDRVNVAEQFDAISCAAYFGDNNASITASTTAQEVLFDMHGDPTATPPVVGRAMAESIGYYQGHGLSPGAPTGLAQQLTDHMGRDISFIAYEGGQHYISGLIYQSIKDAQRMPEIYDAVFENLTAFKDAGGSLFMSFNFINDQDDNNGPWGHMEYQDQSLIDAHKMRAVLDFPNHE